MTDTDSPNPTTPLYVATCQDDTGKTIDHRIMRIGTDADTAWEYAKLMVITHATRGARWPCVWTAYGWAAACLEGRVQFAYPTAERPR